MKVVLIGQDRFPQVIEEGVTSAGQLDETFGFHNVISGDQERLLVRKIKASGPKLVLSFFGDPDRPEVLCPDMEVVGEPFVLITENAAAVFPLESPPETPEPGGDPQEDDDA